MKQKDKVQTPSYYSILPADVRYDKGLKPNAKILYSEITALCNKEGYCWAQNSYFANLYNVKEETVSRWVSNLKKRGYINTVVVPNEEGSQRIITLDKKVKTPTKGLTKKSKGVCLKSQAPLDKKVNHNTTINNTNNSAAQHTELNQFDVQDLIKANKEIKRGDSLKNRRLILNIAKPFFNTTDFTDQWVFMCERIPNAKSLKPQEIILDWIMKGQWKNVSDFNINQLRGWIKHASNRLKAVHVDNEKINYKPAVKRL